ncbi:hypothetical protein FB451DRAFT_1174714 [Mycena latifolia]|nr:hypothetical protein FB451DRAFT_1174714 [Mycena latifolia]
MYTSQQSLLWGLSILLSASHAASFPVDTRSSGPPTFKVLAYKGDIKPTSQTSEYADSFCHQAQIPFIQGGIQVAQELATEAAQLLSQPNAFQSEVVASFLGRKTTPELLESLVKLRFTNVAQSLSKATLVQVAAIDTSGNDKDSSVTTYKADVSNPNRMNTFSAPNSPGITILHEAQHNLLILQSNDPKDNAFDNYISPSDCTKTTITAARKQVNAENFALLGFLAHADPARFKPPPPTTSQT